MGRFRYIAGQDLASLVIGDLVEDGGAWSFVDGPRVIEATPESYAAHCFRDLDGVEGFVVVTSPGSATALRVSVALVNAYAFTKEMPIIGIEHPVGAAVGDIVSAISGHGTRSFAVPRYVNDPKITAPTHDALKRKIAP